MTFTRRADAVSWLSDERRYLEATPAATWEHPKTRWEKKQSSQVSLITYASKQIDRMSIRPGTRETYRSLWKTRINTAEDLAKPIDLITQEDITSWVEWMNREHPTPPRNIDAWNLLNRCVQVAVKQRLMGDVMKGTKPLLIRETPSEQAIPTLPQLNAIISAMPPVYRPMLLTMAWCGLRLGEARELRLGDIRRDGDSWSLRISRSAARVQGKTIIGPTKTGVARTVAVPSGIIPALQARVDSLETTNDLLFFNGQGSQVQPSNFRSRFSEAAKAAGCPEVHPHSLRHFAGTMFATLGATTREIMDRLGHKDVDTAMIYQHVAQSRQKDLMRGLDKLIEGAS